MQGGGGADPASYQAAVDVLAEATVVVSLQCYNVESIRAHELNIIRGYACHWLIVRRMARWRAVICAHRAGFSRSLSPPFYSPHYYSAIVFCPHFRNMKSRRRARLLLGIEPSSMARPGQSRPSSWTAEAGGPRLSLHFPEF